MNFDRGISQFPFPFYLLPFTFYLLPSAGTVAAQERPNFQQEPPSPRNKQQKLRNSFQELLLAGLHASFRRLSAVLHIERMSAQSSFYDVFYMEEVMNTVTKLVIAGAFASTAFAGAALAEGTIYTRSADAAQADLVRDWNFNGGGNAGVVHQRTQAEMQADLVRDWQGPSKAAISAETTRSLQTRTAQQTYDDLVRNWN